HSSTVPVSLPDAPAVASAGSAACHWLHNRVIIIAPAPPQCTPPGCNRVEFAARNASAPAPPNLLFPTNGASTTPPRKPRCKVAPPPDPQPPHDGTSNSELIHPSRRHKETPTACCQS